MFKTPCDLKHSTSIVEHGGASVMMWVCLAVTGIDNRRLNSEVHSQTQMDKDPNHTVRATYTFLKVKKLNIIKWASHLI